MSYPSHEFGAPRSFIGTWAATLLLIAGFITGLVYFPPIYGKPAEEAATTVLFIGRFHPILLHLPVGALIVLSVMELVCLTRPGEAAMGISALFVLWIGAAGSVLAVLAGIMLSREGGYESGNFTLHQTLALAGTIGVLLALMMRLWGMGKANFAVLHAYRAVFYLSFAIMGLGAHFGGNMSHGSKFLTEHAPEPIRSQMIGMEKWMLSFAEKPKAPKPSPLPESATEPLPNPPPGSVPVTPVANPPDKEGGNSANAPASPGMTSAPPSPAVEEPLGGMPSAAGGGKLVFQHVILPILEAKCNNCHNEDKSKGDLRLDTYEMAMQGGESGSNLVPGKPEESLTMQRIDLPVDDDEHMPPDGKDQLTAEETALIRWWIQQGASNTQTVAGSTFPPDTQAAVDALLKGQP